VNRTQAKYLASDDERARVSDALNTAMKSGRLKIDEYDDRIFRVPDAQTYGELDELVKDLPNVGPIFDRVGSQPVQSSFWLPRNGEWSSRWWRILAVMVLSVGLILATAESGSILSVVCLVIGYAGGFFLSRAKYLGG
jgi:hypothetical protein